MGRTLRSAGKWSGPQRDHRCRDGVGTPHGAGCPQLYPLRSREHLRGSRPRPGGFLMEDLAPPHHDKPPLPGHRSGHLYLRLLHHGGGGPQLPWGWDSPLRPQLGGMMNEGRVYINRAPWIIFFPGVFLAISVLSFNLVGDALRDRLDPKLRNVV